MDFACSPAIVEALKARAAHPIYGYTDDEPENRLAEVNFLKRRFDLTVASEWILASPSVVDSMLFSLYALTAPGERVLIQPPVYGPFRAVSYTHLDVYKRQVQTTDKPPRDARPEGAFCCSAFLFPFTSSPDGP